MERKSSTGMTVKRVPGPKTGPEAMAAIGMPKEFAAQLMLLAQKYGVTIAIRASMPEQLYRDTSHPKPSDVKAKTGDWGLSKGVITEDPELGKHNSNGQPINVAMKHSDRIITTPHRISLRNILKCLHSIPPTMLLINQDDIANNKFLLLKCLDAPPDKRDYVYKIDLNSGIAPLDINTQHIKVRDDSPRVKPAWWSNELGDFGAMLEMRLPIELRKTKDQSFQPVNVLAIRNEKGEPAPITGDMDLLWISRPSDNLTFVQFAKFNGIPLFAEMDLSRPENINIMRDHMRALCAIEDGDEINFDRVTDEKLARMGCITPFEAYIITIINQRFATFVDHLDDLIQHGCENRNPGKASDLNTGVLHCTNGLCTLTTSELELINFVLATPDYMKKYRLELNPSWDMSKDKWGRVVDGLLEASHEVDSKVIDKYCSHSSPLRKWSLTFQQFGRRLSSAGSPPPPPSRKNSVVNFSVQIVCPDYKYFSNEKSLLGSKNKNMLAALCEAQQIMSQGNITWTLDSDNFIAAKFKNADGSTQLYHFKIDANSISLISGDLDENSKSVFKCLHDALLRDEKIIINSANSDNKLALEQHLSPPSPGLHNNNQ